LKESDIRKREIHNKYLELVRLDAEKLFHDKSKFVYGYCPACDSSDCPPAFEKNGFIYAQCENCKTLFVNPRPDFQGISSFYSKSESTSYWVNDFFLPMLEIRREKMFNPRAKHLSERFPMYSEGRIADIGSGFGVFLEELKKYWPKAKIDAIEPSEEMAKIIRSKGFSVIESMVEDVKPSETGYDLITSFELFEHLHDPKDFLEKIAKLIKKGGYLYLTTLNGQGFDIQLFWEKSKSVFPPHHLNFFNPRSIKILLEKTGYELVEVSTPGELDWDIVEGSYKNDGFDPGRFFRTVVDYANEDDKKRLQEWISSSNFSSHMRIIARKL